MSFHQLPVWIVLTALVLAAHTGFAQDGPSDVCLPIGYGPPPVFETTADPRAAAMGGATVAGPSRSSHALFSDPTELATLGGVRAGAGYLHWNGTISVVTASASGRLFGDRGTYGATLTGARYGNSYVPAGACQTEDQDDRSAAGASLGYASRVSENVILGGRLKYRQQQPQVLQREIGRAVDLDLGVSIETGIRSLLVKIRGENVLRGLNEDLLNDALVDPGSLDRELEARLHIGAGMNVLTLLPETFISHQLWLATELERRGIDDRLRLGGEYLWRETVMLRAGYALAFQGNSNFPWALRWPEMNPWGLQHAGIGLRQQFDGLRMGLDYAFSYGEQQQNNTNRVVLSARF